jgi:protein-tyrosine phosphatase
MKVYDSINYPLNINYLTFPNIKGKLGLTMCPGKKQKKLKIGKCWNRDTITDLLRLKFEFNMNILVSLMKFYEYEKFKCNDLFYYTRLLNIKHMIYPIRDMNTPLDSDIDDIYMKLIIDISNELKKGKNIIIHCLGGLGRSGTIAACVNMYLDNTVNYRTAIKAIRRVRPGAVQNKKQEKWIKKFYNRNIRDKRQ